MNIKTFRTQQQLTQAELAEKLGLTQGAISHYENGRRLIDKPFADKFIAYAESVGVTLTYNDVFSATPTQQEGAAA